MRKKRANISPWSPRRFRKKEWPSGAARRHKRFLKVRARRTRRDWKTEYLDLIISVRVVESLAQAVDHVNRYGSRHTDAIVTADEAAARTFLSRVDAASVMWNASTRLADGFRYGFGAEVGIATDKIHARGPVGLEGLVTYKYQIEGNGHLVSDYEGADARAFLHKPLPLSE